MTSYTEVFLSFGQKKQLVEQPKLYSVQVIDKCLHILVTIVPKWQHIQKCPIKQIALLFRTFQKRQFAQGTLNSGAK